MTIAKTYQCSCGQITLYEDQCSDCRNEKLQQIIDRERSKREDFFTREVCDHLKMVIEECEDCKKDAVL